jgi:hypothetical protein
MIEPEKQIFTLFAQKFISPGDIGYLVDYK